MEKLARKHLTDEHQEVLKKLTSGAQSERVLPGVDEKAAMTVCMLKVFSMPFAQECRGGIFLPSLEHGLAFIRGLEGGRKKDCGTLFSRH